MKTKRIKVNFIEKLNNLTDQQIVDRLSKDANLRKLQETLIYLDNIQTYSK